MKSKSLTQFFRLTCGVVFVATILTAQGQTSLLHHWRFDSDGSDSVGAANATLETNVAITTGGQGQFGEALSVPETANGAVIGPAEAPDFPASDFTYTVWVKRNGGQVDGTVMGNQQGGASAGAWIRVDDPGNVAFARTNGTAALVSGGTVPNNVWTHLAMTVSSTAGLTVYVDGVVVASDPTGTSHTVSTGSFEFGTRPDSGIQQFHGLIDDAAIFSGVLTETQIANVISAGAPNFDLGSDSEAPGLVGTTPVAGSTSAPVGENLVATFNEGIQAGSSGAIELWRIGTPDVLVEDFSVATSTQLAFEGAKVTIDPGSDLIKGEEYYVTIDAGAVEDIAGNPFAGLTTRPPDVEAWTFTGDNTAPVSSSIEPMNGASGVSPSGVLVLTFNENVLAGSGDITIRRSDNDGLVQAIDVTSELVAVGGGEVTISFQPLDLGVSFYVTISGTAFMDRSGNAYAGISDKNTWAFTTASTTLTHHWQFEGDAVDTAGDHDGTLLGNANYAAGIRGQAISLDGDGDSVLVNQASLPDTDFTLAAWVFRETNGERMYVAGTQSSGSLGAFLRMDDLAGDGKIFVNLLPPPDTQKVAGGFVPLNTWTHVAMTVSGAAGLSLYVDGIVVASDPTATGHTPGSNFRIGARPDGNTFGFDGLIDDVRIYSSVLSLNEIAALAGNAEPGPVVIESISPVGGGSFELTLSGAANTAYEFHSSTTLIFDPGTLVEGLTQSEPNDAGVIGGPNNSVVTTNDEGLATVRVLFSARPSNFVLARAISAP